MPADSFSSRIRKGQDHNHPSQGGADWTSGRHHVAEGGAESGRCERARREAHPSATTLERRAGEPMTADTWLKRRHEAAPASPQVVDAVTPGRAIAVNAS